MPRVPHNPNDYTVNFLSKQKAQTSASAQQVGPGIQAANIPAVSWPTTASAAATWNANWQVPYLATTTGLQLSTDSTGSFVTVNDPSFFSAGDLICIENAAGGFGGGFPHNTGYTEFFFVFVTRVTSTAVYFNPSLNRAGNLLTWTFRGYSNGPPYTVATVGSTVGVVPSVTTPVKTGQGVNGLRLDATVSASINTTVSYPTSHIGVAAYIGAIRTKSSTLSTSFNNDLGGFVAQSVPTYGTQMTSVFSGENGLPAGSGWTTPPEHGHNRSVVLTLAKASSDWFTTTANDVGPQTQSVTLTSLPDNLPPANTDGMHFTDFTIGSKGTSPIQTLQCLITPAGVNGRTQPNLSISGSNYTFGYNYPAGTPVYQPTTVGSETWTFFPFYSVSDSTQNIECQPGQLIIDPR